MDPILIWIALTIAVFVFLCAYSYVCARLNVIERKGGWIGYPFGYVLLASLDFYFSERVAREFWLSRMVWKTGVEIASLATAVMFLLIIIVVSRMVIPEEKKS